MRLSTMPFGAGFATIAFVYPSVLIVDDHAEFREAAAAVLEAGGFRIVGGVVDGESAVLEAARLRPDIVVVDIQLPGIDGFAVAELLARDPDPPDVVLVSGREAATYGGRVSAAPALGFLPKRDLSAPALNALLS